MKKFSRLNLFLILFFSFFINLYGTEFYKTDARGKELCDEIFSFLDNYNFNPTAQDLLLRGKNNFPYNIFVSVKPEEYSNQNLVFTFFQEDVLKNSKIITDTIRYVKQNHYNFNIIFLFAYGEKETIQKQGAIYGIDAFLKNINTNDDYTNYIIDLGANENSIKTSSNGVTSPSWLIQNQYNIYIKYKINELIPYFYLSQLYKSNFFHDRILSAFFDYEIPSIKLNFEKSSINNELVYSILKDSIEEYNKEPERIWDQHFLMLNIFGQFKRLTEVGTIKIIMIIIFAWLVFILLLIFINSRKKQQAWGTIKHIWYSAPVSFLLVYVSFTIGKYISLGIFNNNSNIDNVFILISIQLILSIILVSAYYGLTLQFNLIFYEKSIDYLIVLSCFVNQSFFILLDVSLFPIFMMACLLSLIALSIKNNGIHIAIFFLMVVPILPYLISVIRFADFNSLYNYLISENFVPFFISLIIFPSFLIYFRVLTSIKRKQNININVLLLTGISIAILTIIIILSCIILSNYLHNHEKKNEKVSIYKSYENIVDFSYEDKLVFDDIIRTINIKFSEQPEQCNINVSSLSSTPILYTENEYEYITPTTSTFKIPSNPPKELTFSYGASAEPSLISISAMIPTGKPLEYKSINKVVTIGK